jgi:hypothetical protein
MTPLIDKPAQTKCQVGWSAHRTRRNVERSDIGRSNLEVRDESVREFSRRRHSSRTGNEIAKCSEFPGCIDSSLEEVVARRTIVVMGDVIFT